MGLQEPGGTQPGPPEAWAHQDPPGCAHSSRSPLTSPHPARSPVPPSALMHIGVTSNISRKNNSMGNNMEKSHWSFKKFTSVLGTGFCGKNFLAGVSQRLAGPSCLHRLGPCPPLNALVCLAQSRPLLQAGRQRFSTWGTRPKPWGSWRHLQGF